MTGRYAVLTMALVLAVAMWVPAVAGDCPAGVTAAAMKAHPDAKIDGCKKETEEGKVQYSVKLTGNAGEKLELDVSPEGQILLTEEPVAVNTLPPAVLQGLKAKHPDAKPERAVRQTGADGKVTYEIAFHVGKEKKEDTFDANGAFVEEE